MGSESYIIRAYPNNLDIKSAEILLKETGFKKSVSGYELKTKDGINEVQLGVNSGIVEQISIRFSLASPDRIIEQTARVITFLGNKIDAKFFPEGYKKSIDTSKEINILGMRMAEKMESFRKSAMRGVPPKPVRGGKETQEYIDRYKEKEIGKLVFLRDVPGMGIKKGDDGILVKHGEHELVLGKVYSGNFLLILPLASMKGNVKVRLNSGEKADIDALCKPKARFMFKKVRGIRKTGRPGNIAICSYESLSPIEQISKYYLSVHKDNIVWMKMQKRFKMYGGIYRACFSAEWIKKALIPSIEEVLEKNGEKNNKVLGMLESIRNIASACVKYKKEMEVTF